VWLLAGRMAQDSIKVKYLICGAPNTAKAEGTHLTADPTGETDYVGYASGRSAVVRSVSDPKDVKVFLEHKAPVTVVRFSPDGQLVASADEHGTIHVWNRVTGIQKHEMQGSGSIIRDIMFSSDMKFMMVGSEARGTFAKAIKFPSGGAAGKSCGGHTKRVLAVDIRMKPSKQIIVASEDFRVSIHKGPPVGEYSTPKVLNYHTNFVNDIRYSPDGTRFATCSTDRSICILDSESHEVLQTITGHDASVLQLCWSKDGTQVISASSDHTIRTWDATTGSEKQCIKVGEEASDQQSSVVVIPKTEEIVSLSLDGTLNVFDAGASEPKTKLYGHSKVPVGLELVGDTLYSADYMGKLVPWKVGEGSKTTEKLFNGVHGPTTLSAIAANSKIVATIGMDGHVFLIPTDTLKFPEPIEIKGGGKDISIASDPVDGAACVVVLNEARMVAISYDGSILAEFEFDKGHRATSVALSDDGKEICASYEVSGGAGELLFGQIEGGKFVINEGSKVSLLTPANKLAYSPDGSHVVIGEMSRRVRFVSAKGEEVGGGGLMHSARVDAVAFAPDGKLAVTGGLDGSVAVWQVGTKGDYRRLKSAHRGGVTGIAFAGDGTIFTAGGDNAIIAWTMDEAVSA